MNYIAVTGPNQSDWLFEENQFVEFGIERSLLKVRINRFSQPTSAMKCVQAHGSPLIAGTARVVASRQWR